MHILIISDAYPPMRTSCATQIYDLAQAFIGQDHQVSIIIPAHSQKNVVEISTTDGPTVYSVRCFKTKDVGYARRTIAEFINPFIIGFHLKRNSHFISQKIDGITWYSPTVFWGPLVRQLKAIFNCKAYLILRDIFPDWALDLGILKENLIYAFFKKVERYQYSQADCIGVQSPNNLKYFQKHNPLFGRKVEVLWNWCGQKINKKCSIEINKSVLEGKKICVYAGNMGVAQGINYLFELVKFLKNNEGIGFVFVGRGSELAWLRAESDLLGLKNIIFYDEIDSKEIAGLYAQCHAGLLSLDSRHTTHNMPGKLIGYLESKLPIVGFVNKNNDLIKLSHEHSIGLLFDTISEETLSQAEIFINNLDSYEMNTKLIMNLFDSTKTIEQLTFFLNNK